MKQQITIIVSSLSLLFFIATSASAQNPGPYLSFTGGLNIADEMTLTDQEGNYITSFEPGFFSGGAIGFDLGDGFPQLGKGRIELEIGYHYNELKESQFATGSVDAEGDLSTLSVMFNTVGEYRDHSSNYYPYFGLGVGTAIISMNETSVAGYPMIDDSSVQLAYQVMAGISIPFSEKLFIDLGYRYFGALDPEFTDSQGNTVDAEIGNHNAEISLRFKF